MKKHRFRVPLTAVVGLVAMLALASPAAASTAHWNVSSTLAHWPGSLTIETRGKTPVTCSSLDMRVQSENDQFNNGKAKLTSPEGFLTISCPGSTKMQFYHAGDASFSGTNYILALTPLCNASCGGMQTPFGEKYIGWETATGVVTNGSGTTPSKITFSKDEVGVMEFTFAPVYISGTLTMTTSTGGLLTLSI